MEAFFSSFGLVALSEMGDKTQLLALLLTARFRKPWAIIAGIFTASLLSNGLASSFGSLVATALPPNVLAIALAILFALFGLWTLKADDDEEKAEQKPGRLGAYWTTVIFFFIGELGDKTQLSTIALGAAFPNPICVTLGTTLGMTSTDALAVLVGEKMAGKFKMRWIRVAAAASFFAFSLFSLYTAMQGAADG
ncbi:MAG TPA: hypothetical protein DCS07_12270 [Bdellovibrionales bacterium]|nr:MAG: hypothetical protein A2Z97_16425 [Bdellovibrionales bacterium GWB1_52_6]OFZ02784.1 MAG: hypothetical protein A2X97_04220 [Bdellovibrionales bacterium GWA1_52_35]OFZ44147.1 MAG: hypothetical protein A2070_07275 [Bdellovibrionales bacterium GWC1_52_8]HAR43385.1 hypothetical protein [Bdellovibrionales bacterium]HCM38366.1 hypothetical protein [Bdellovibrionales bacterium]